MTDTDRLIIQPLNASHRRQDFDCGLTALNDYLQKQARQDIKRRISRVFVASACAEAQRILGYYTLSSLSVDLAALPQEQAKKLPKHPIPMALLGRLAVAKAAQGQGIGAMLLVDVIARTLAVADDIGIHGLVVDAIDPSAQRFYEAFGFSLLDAKARRLFLPLKPAEWARAE